MATLHKNERFALFRQRLLDAPPASSLEEAFATLAATLNAVEDELSGIPNNPSNWQNDGRMYPPQRDHRRTPRNAPGVVRYRSVGHNTFIAENGSIRIEMISREVVLKKPGADGRIIADGEGGGLTIKEPGEYLFYAMDNEFQRFRRLVGQSLAGCVFEIDSASRDSNQCWVEIYFRKTAKTIEFKAGEGFGIFADDPAYGEGPIEIYQTAEEASNRLAELFQIGTKIAC
jgi:hypothetical protein